MGNSDINTRTNGWVITWELMIVSSFAGGLMLKGFMRYRLAIPNEWDPQSHLSIVFSWVCAWRQEPF